MIPAYAVLTVVLGYLVFRFLIHQPAPAVSQAAAGASSTEQIDRTEVLLPETPVPAAPSGAISPAPPPTFLSPDRDTGRRHHR